MRKKPGRTWIVARFEFGNYLKTRAFMLSTMITCILILAALFFPNLKEGFQSLGGGKEKSRLTIVNETESPLPESALREALDTYTLEFKSSLTAEEEEEKLRQKNSAGVFYILAPQNYAYHLQRRAFNQYPEESLLPILETHFQSEEMLKAGLSRHSVEEILKAPDIRIVESAENEGKSQEQTQFYTYVLILGLYVSILNYGQLTAVSVASEKSSRAMEILITSSDAHSLMNGKILGTGLAGLFQLLIFALVYLLASLFRFQETGAVWGQMGRGNLQIPLGTCLLALAVFILSYLSFAYLYGALGSLVNRSEEVSQVIAPVTSFYVLIFLAGMFATFHPEEIWVHVLSYLPFFGPLLFFVRFAMLSLHPLELLAYLSVHAVYAWLIAHTAIRVYRNGVLRYGKSPRFSDFFHFAQKKESAASQLP